VENMEERQVEKGKDMELAFLPYFSCLFTIQLVFLLYFPYLFTIQLLSLTIVKISLKILIGEKTEENCEMIWNIWMKCEMTWKIWKKGKLKREKIWKIGIPSVFSISIHYSTFVTNNCEDFIKDINWGKNK
jgi:hypothetical protein